jgi:hypothetical protein
MGVPFVIYDVLNFGNLNGYDVDEPATHITTTHGQFSFALVAT